MEAYISILSNLSPMGGGADGGVHLLRSASTKTNVHIHEGAIRFEGPSEVKRH